MSVEGAAPAPMVAPAAAAPHLLEPKALTPLASEAMPFHPAGSVCDAGAVEAAVLRALSPPPPLRPVLGE